MNLFLRFTPRALDYWLYSLPQWQRERVAEIIVALLNEPRPRVARRAKGYGEAYEIYGADARILYRIYKDDQKNDIGIVVARIHEFGSGKGGR